MAHFNIKMNRIIFNNVYDEVAKQGIEFSCRVNRKNEINIRTFNKVDSNIVSELVLSEELRMVGGII